jgi:hypothetical protein
MGHLNKCALVAEWVGYAEPKDFGHFVQKSKAGRPKGGVARAARELPVPGNSFDARRKFIERALKVDGILPEAKSAVRDAVLDDVQSALLEIASERSIEAQLAKVKEIALRRAQPRRDSGGSTANRAKAEAERLQVELATVTERLRHIEHELETARAMASSAPLVDASMKAPTDGGIPPFLDRRPLSPADKLAFDAVMAAWADATALRAALVRASPVVHGRFIAVLRVDIASSNSAAK